MQQQPTSEFINLRLDQLTRAEHLGPEALRSATESDRAIQLIVVLHRIAPTIAEIEPVALCWIKNYFVQRFIGPTDLKVLAKAELAVRQATVAIERHQRANDMTALLADDREDRDTVEILRQIAREHVLAWLEARR